MEERSKVDAKSFTKSIYRPCVVTGNNVSTFKGLM